MPSSKPCWRVVAGAALLASTGATSAQEVVKIGHVGPTSGSIAHLGKDNENGARMAIDELNARGVTIGGKRAKIELLAEDDAADPKQGTAAAQKLVDSKVNGVIGHLNSGTSIPASKIYSDAGIPQISPSATNPLFTRQGFKTTFRVITEDNRLAQMLAEYAAKDLKLKSVAVIDDGERYGKNLAGEFERAAKAAGINVVAREVADARPSAFSSWGQRLKSAKPDAIFFGGMDSIAGPVLRHLKDLGVGAKFIGGDGICTSDLPKLAAGTIADGQVICAESGGIEPKTLDDFRTAFKKKFGADVQMYAPYVYDAVNVMVAAMVKAGSADPAKYLSVLAKTEGHKGITGVISFDSKGDLKNNALTLYTFDRDGRRKQLSMLGVPIVRSSAGGGRYGWNTDPTDRDPRNDPRRPPPRTPDHIYVPNKDLGSHRAAGDAAGSPTAVATMTGGPTPSNGQESFNVMAANSAWGSKEEAAACLRALQSLSARGRVDDFKSTNDPDGLAAERGFAVACLGTPDQRIAPRVGVLRSDRGVECTVTLLTADTAITARHCVFSNPRFPDPTQLRATAVAVPDEIRALSVSFGPLETAPLIKIREVLARDEGGTRRVSPDGNDRSILRFSTLDQLQGDYALLVLATPVAGFVMPALQFVEPRKKDKIYMASYYPGHSLVPMSPETGLRQQTSGTCQVVEARGRCFAHGCATNGAASGSAIFVERGGELRLAGVHSSGAAKDPHTRCEVDSGLATYFNIGVHVRIHEVSMR